jgi:hypothetical protein
MGGVNGLVAWGRENPGDFYRLYAKLATSEPANVVLDLTHPRADTPVNE